MPRKNVGRYFDAKQLNACDSGIILIIFKLNHLMKGVVLVKTI